jgi:hypothetical protein
MHSKVWFARTLFYFSTYLRGFVPMERNVKAREAQRSKPAPLALLRPSRKAH